MPQIDDAASCILRPVRTAVSLWAGHSLRLLTSLIAVLTMVAALSSAAECGVITFEPSVSIGEEYDDNVYITPDNKTADYITHVIPSIQAAYSAPVWDWKLTYSYDYRYYAYDSYRDDHPQKLDLLSTTRIVKDLLFLDVRDSYGRTSLSAVQNFTQQSLVKNLTDYNTFEVNPYAALQLTSRLTLTTGYQYRNLWYKDPNAIDQVIHSVYGDLARKTTDRTNLTALARYNETVSSVNTQKRTTFLVGARHEYQEGSYLWGSIGAIRSSTSGSTTGTQPAWEAGISHAMPTTSVSFETGRTFIEDPLVINRREDRYIADLRIGKERTNGGITVGIRNYAQERYLTDRRYSTAVDFSHYLTENIQGKYVFSIDRYERYPADAPDNMTIVYITDVRFDYHVSESTGLSLNYVYTDSYSATIYTDNYTVNRVLLSLGMKF